MMPSHEPNHSKRQRTRLVSLLNGLINKDGLYPSPVAGVELARESAPMARTPVVYKPGIIIVAQGRKRGYVGEEVLQYDPYNYLVLSVPLPFECEYECSPEMPLLAVVVDIDPTMIGEVLLQMDEGPSATIAAPRAIYATPLDDRLSAAVIKLLETMQSQQDSKVLGPMIVREIVYLILKGEQGNALRALTARGDHFNQIARVLRLIHQNPAQDFDAESLARKAGMSISTFHQTFKRMTATSPIQYIKRMRLDSARRLMVHEGYNVSTAATAMSYESISQFSREFKRLFGSSPAEEAARLRTRLAGATTA